MNIVILGSGNIATHFAHNFHRQGHHISQVYSKQKANAQALAFAVEAEAIDDLIAVRKDADLYVLAISDAAIIPVIEQLSSTLAGLIVHCSGATDIDVLQKFGQYGVIYPPQTISKNQKTDFSFIPFCIEGNSMATCNRLMELMLAIAPKSIPCSSQQRLAIHIASVFANNFSNVLYQISQDILEKQGLTFDLIKPIILETAQKVQTNLPKDVQTGPAIRNDRITIEKHLDFISNQEDWKQIYQLLTQEIVKRKN